MTQGITRVIQFNSKDIRRSLCTSIEQLIYSRKLAHISRRLINWDACLRAVLTASMTSLLPFRPILRRHFFEECFPQLIQRLLGEKNSARNAARVNFYFMWEKEKKIGKEPGLCLTAARTTYRVYPDLIYTMISLR